MKKIIILLLAACLAGVGQTMADNVLTVSDVNIPQGGQATVEVGCAFDTEFTAFELQLVLPEGLSLLADEDGKPIVERAFDGSHTLNGSLLPSNGNYKFTAYSTNAEDLSMPTSGPLFRVTLLADASLPLGTSLNATVTACEFTRTADSQGETLGDVSFAVSISEFRTLIDESATELPVAEENANVRVRRTIKAGEWSTLVLPFAMTADQVGEAFGIDAQLADFINWTSEEDDDGAIVGIKVGFATVAAMEANHPYIIKVQQDISEFTVDDVDIDPEDEPVVQVGRRAAERGYFHGTFVTATIPEENVFLSGNQFWYSTGKTQTKGLRGYFEFRDVLDAYYDAADAGARINMVLDGDMATGIRDTRYGESSSHGCYDLQGRRVTASRKGIYVKDGKKVVVK